MTHADYEHEAAAPASHYRMFLTSLRNRDLRFKRSNTAAVPSNVLSMPWWKMARDIGLRRRLRT